MFTLGNLVEILHQDIEWSHMPKITFKFCKIWVTLAEGPMYWPYLLLPFLMI